MPTAIEETTFKSASALLGALSRRRTCWQPRPTEWVFRGHSDADAYKLLPTALRDTGVRLGTAPNTPVGRKSTNQEQINGEFEVLQAFFEEVDHAGLHVPEDSQSQRSPEGWLRFQQDAVQPALAGTGFWPPTETLSMLALAQHHGVPTRLMDWTYAPFTAAFFAALGAAQQVKSGTCTARHFSVWALNLGYVWSRYHNAYFDPTLYTMPRADIQQQIDHTLVRSVTAPRASNPNLNAQEGLFTVVQKMHENHAAAPQTATLDQVIAAQVLRDQSSGWLASSGLSLPVMRHLKVPLRAAPELLRLLDQEGVNSSRLFPGFAGAAKAVAERLLWDRKA